MANALQMYLMSGASTALISERPTSDADGSMMAGTANFSDAMSELNQNGAMTERQKAALSTAIHTAIDNDNAPDPHALKAILVDDDSSSSEKDSARALLAIIQSGKEASAELTLSADKTKFSGASSLALDALSAAVTNISTVDGETENSSETAHEDDDAAALQSKSANAERGAAISTLVTTTSAMATKDSQALDADKAATSKDSVVVALATKALTKSGEKQIDEQAETAPNKRQANHQSAIQSVASAKADHAGDEGNSKPEIKLPAAVSELEQKATKAPATMDAILQAAENKASTMDAKIQVTADQVLPIDNDYLHQDQSVKRTSGITVPSKYASAVAADLSSAKANQKSAIDLIAAARQESDTLQSTDLGSVVLEPRLEAAVRHELSMAQPTLASATQSRAEQTQAAMNATGNTGGQGNPDEKGQRHSSSINQEQWQQASSGSDQGGADKQTEVTPRTILAAEQHARIAGLGVSSQQGSEALLTSTNSTLATTQFVQSQGVAVPSQTVSAQINDMLKQPMNLLAADATGQLRERLVMMVRHSIHSAEIKLDPAELGSMTIRVNMQQDQASVQFLVQQAHAKEVLEQQLPRLRDMLQEQGIQLTDGQVEQQGSHQSNDQKQGQEQQATGLAADELSEATIMSKVPSDRLVDYYA